MDSHMQPDLPLEPARMQPSDLEDILAIERTSFASPWSRDMFYEEMKNRNARLVVFRLERKIVGYICFWVVLDEAHVSILRCIPNNGAGAMAKQLWRISNPCAGRRVSTACFSKWDGAMPPREVSTRNSGLVPSDFENTTTR